MHHKTTIKRNGQGQTNALDNQTSSPTPSEDSAASYWDESQVQAVIRHAGSTGRSPEEFFNKKWKNVLCRKAS